jgi:peptidyl-prolyl cis-trans isomerase C
MRVLREPLVHFFAGGLFLFVVGAAVRERPDTHHIVLTSQREAQLASRYAQQFGARPDASTMDELVKSDVHDEILFRQGLTLGLDKDDEIVRRRIIQKMRFLLEDLHPPPEPTEAQLQDFYRAHPERYVLPARVTFTHVYFSAEQGDAGARSRAYAALDGLSADQGRGPGRARGIGDPFPDLQDFSHYAREQVYRLFGRTDFSARVFSVPPGKWAGPFKSAYGWHLIYVQSREEAQTQPLASVRDKVRADYLLDSQSRANEIAFSTLERQFTIARNRQRTL